MGTEYCQKKSVQEVRIRAASVRSVMSTNVQEKQKRRMQSRVRVVQVKL
jgi:hypothetical protein